MIPSLPNHRLTLLFPGPVCLRPLYWLPLYPNATCASALQMPPPHLSTYTEPGEVGAPLLLSLMQAAG